MTNSWLYHIHLITKHPIFTRRWFLPSKAINFPKIPVFPMLVTAPKPPWEVPSCWVSSPFWMYLVVGFQFFYPQTVCVVGFMNAVFGDWNSENRRILLVVVVKKFLKWVAQNRPIRIFFFLERYSPTPPTTSNTTNNTNTTNNQQHHEQPATPPTTSNTRTEILSVFLTPILWGYGFSPGMCQCYRILWENGQGGSISRDVPCCKNTEKNWPNSYGEGDLLWYVCISHIYICI